MVIWYNNGNKWFKFKFKHIVVICSTVTASFQSKWLMRTMGRYLCIYIFLNITVQVLALPPLSLRLKAKGWLLPHFNLIDCQGDWCIDAALKSRGFDSHAYSLTCKVCHGGRSNRFGCLVYHAMSNDINVSSARNNNNILLMEDTG